MNQLIFNIPGFAHEVVFDSDHRGMGLCKMPKEATHVLHTMLFDMSQEFDLVYASLSYSYGILQRYAMPVDESGCPTTDTIGVTTARVDSPRLYAFMGIETELDIEELTAILHPQDDRPMILFLDGLYKGGAANTDLSARLMHVKFPELRKIPNLFFVCHYMLNTEDVLFTMDEAMHRTWTISEDSVPDLPEYDWHESMNPVYGRVPGVTYTQSLLLENCKEVPIGYCHNVFGDLSYMSFKPDGSNAYISLSASALEQLSSVLWNDGNATSIYMSDSCNYYSFPERSISAERFTTIQELHKSIIRKTNLQIPLIICVGMKWDVLIQTDEDYKEFLSMVSYIREKNAEDISIMFIQALGPVPIELLSVCEMRITDSDNPATRALFYGMAGYGKHNLNIGDRVIVNNRNRISYVYLPQAED